MSYNCGSVINKIIEMYSTAVLPKAQSSKQLYLSRKKRSGEDLKLRSMVFLLLYSFSILSELIIVFFQKVWGKLTAFWEFEHIYCNQSFGDLEKDLFMYTSSTNVKLWHYSLRRIKPQSKSHS